METFTINAVVLREVRYKEADAIITLLTAEKGIITASAKGIYKSGSKNRAGVQLFCYSEFEITEGKGGYIVKTALPKELFYNIRTNPEFYALACYISETICAFCTSENDETDMFRLTLNAFAALDAKETKPLWQIKSAYELKLCCLCGFSPMLDACGYCGCPEEDSVEGSEESDFVAGGKYLFSMAEGAILCNDCFTAMLKKGENIVSVKLSRASLYAARYVCESTLGRFLSFKLAETDAAEFADFTEKYLLYVAERGFSSLKYYKQLISELGNPLR